MSHNSLKLWMERIFDINTKNGWFDKDRSFDADIALIHGEASEAHEQYRECRRLDEIYGICKKCDYEYGLDPMMLKNMVCDQPSHLPDGRPIRCGGMISPEGVPVELIDIIVRALDSLKRIGITDPDSVMLMKLQYNQKRGYRHGGKIV